MRRKLILFILAGLLSLSVASCGSSVQDEPVVAPAQEESEKSEDAEPSQEDMTAEEEEVSAGEDSNPETEMPVADVAEVQADDSFSFDKLEKLDFLFASGAGGWGTTLQIHPDGSFEGQYHDSDMGSTGDGYPNGTMYLCNFTGQFTQPVKVDDHTYSMQIARKDYEQQIGTEEIKDGVLYCYSDAYGLEEAQNILIYLPGKPLAELSEDFLYWVGYYDLSATTDTELPFYAINNEAKEEGFVGHDIVADIKYHLQQTNEYTSTLGQSIDNDPLSQAELNEKSQWMYEEWDYVLNELWRVLKRTLDSDRMRVLTDEQRAWIAEKEQTVADAGAEFEGGSMQPMIMNLRAAKLTKERVYELMELLE